MTPAREVVSSSYMHWAKTSSGAKFNLAMSGMPNLKLRELRVSLDDLEITDGGYGYQPLMQAIAKRYRVATNAVVTAAGTTFANHLAMAALIRPGDEVLFEYPAYEPMLAACRYLGANVKRFSRKFENDFQISTDELESSVTLNTRLIVITNLHNPSSVLIDDATMTRIGEIAKRAGARVLVDEVYVETLFEETPRSSFHLGNQFVVTSSLTKAFGLSGLRCGWILAEPELARRMWLLNDLFASTPVHAGERLSVVAMQQLAEIGDRAKQLLDRNRRILNEFLDTRDDLEAVRPEFGTTMFPRVRGASSEELFACCARNMRRQLCPEVFSRCRLTFELGLRSIRMF